MLVAVVHTEGSVCRCHEAIAGALTRGGHEAVVVDALGLVERGASLARGARVAFDHTDTVRGSGRRRGESRRVLEAAGISVAGGTADACDLADDKARARDRMSGTVPMPRGRLMEWNHAGPHAIGWPRVLKSPHEHMSRGVALVRDAAEQRDRAFLLSQAYGDPVLVEEYIEGREVAVTVLEGPHELETMPVVEWPRKEVLLSLDEKLDPGVVPFLASLHAKETAAIVEASRAAFLALGLRDYARVDLRLAADGRAYVLEVNPRPSLEPDAPTAICAPIIGLTLDELILSLLARAAARAGCR